MPFTADKSLHYVVRYEFQAQKDDQIDILPGEIIVLSKTSDTGWWRGFRMRDGAKGWFPGEYVEKVEDSDTEKEPDVDVWDGTGDAGKLQVWSTLIETSHLNFPRFT